MCLGWFVTSLRQAVLRELAASGFPMAEHEIKIVLQSSKELWWWQRLLVAHRLHGVLRQLVLDRRVEYLRHEGRRRGDRVRFKYSLAFGDTSPGASRRTP